MDVCESEKQYSRVIYIFQKMVAMKIRPSKSSIQFILRACEKMGASSVALMAALDEAKGMKQNDGHARLSTVNIGDSAVDMGKAVTILLEVLLQEPVSSRAQLILRYKSIVQRTVLSPGLLANNTEAQAIILVADECQALPSVFMDFDTLSLRRALVGLLPFQVNITRVYETLIQGVIDGGVPTRIKDTIVVLDDVGKSGHPDVAADLALLTIRCIGNAAVSLSQEFGMIDLKEAKRGIDTTSQIRSVMAYEYFQQVREILSNKATSLSRAYTTVAILLRDAADCDTSLLLFQQGMSESKQQKNSGLRLAVIQTLARSRAHWDTAISIFEDYSFGERQEPAMYRAALTACATGQDVEQALHLLSRLQKDGFAPDTASLTTVISAGRSADAFKILSFMEKNKIHRNVWTYNAAISACTKEKKWKDALRIYEMMRSDLSEADFRNHSLPDVEGQINDFDDVQVTFGHLATKDNNPTEFFDSISSIVTANSLMEVLADGQQDLLIDQIYDDVISREIIKPFVFSDQGLPITDLHFHSVVMAKAAIRFLFHGILLKGSSIIGTAATHGAYAAASGNSLTVITGKGEKLKDAVKDQLSSEFSPPIKCSVLNGNAGRLVLDENDVKAWLSVHGNWTIAKRN
jgi:pentatricopeptide repeat protein